MSQECVTQINSLALKMLISGVNAHKNAAFLQELKQKTGFDYHHPPTISKYETYLVTLDLLCKTSFKDKPVDKACEYIGYRLAKQYIENPVGKVLATAAQMLGTEAASKIFLKAIANFIPEVKHGYDEIGKKHSRYRYRNLVGSPGVMAGMNRLAIEVLGGKNIKVVYTVVSPTEAVFDNSWT